jgi:hypothetical protein
MALDGWELARIEAAIASAIESGISNSVQYLPSAKERRAALLAHLVLKIQSQDKGKPKDRDDYIAEAEGLLCVIEEELKNWPPDEHELQLWGNREWLKGVCSCGWLVSGRNRELIEKEFNEHAKASMQRIDRLQPGVSAGDPIKPNDASS